MDEGMFEMEFGEAQSMETTAEQTAENYAWASYRADRSMSPASRVWVFTDGSTTGWCSTVIVRPGVSVLPVSKKHPKAQMANVQAELNGFLLGLEHVDPDSAVTVVSDYIGIGGWMTGAWQIKNPAVEKAIERAHEIAKEKRLLQGMHFIHHAGHQEDVSDFTTWNTVADRLCGPGEKWPLPAGKALPWLEVEISKAHMSDMDKLAKATMVLRSGNKSRLAHWRVIAKPRAGVEYSWVDTSKGQVGRCMLDSTGAWAEAPVEGAVVLRHTPPTPRARDERERDHRRVASRP